MNRPVKSNEQPCQHTNVSTSGEGAFQYCEECGAVRSRLQNKVGQYTEWHTCDLCRLSTVSS